MRHGETLAIGLWIVSMFIGLIIFLLMIGLTPNIDWLFDILSGVM